MRSKKMTRSLYFFVMVQLNSPCRKVMVYLDEKKNKYWSQSAFSLISKHHLISTESSFNSEWVSVDVLQLFPWHCRCVELPAIQSIEPMLLVIIQLSLTA